MPKMLQDQYKVLQRPTLIQVSRCQILLALYMKCELFSSTKDHVLEWRVDVSNELPSDSTKAYLATARA